MASACTFSNFCIGIVQIPDAWLLQLARYWVCLLMGLQTSEFRQALESDVVGAFCDRETGHCVEA